MKISIEQLLKIIDEWPDIIYNKKTKPIILKRKDDQFMFEIRD